MTEVTVPITSANLFATPWYEVSSLALFWQASLVQEEVVPLYVWLHTEQDQHRYDLRVWAGLTRQGRMMSARDLEEQVWLVSRECPVAIW